MLHITKTTNLIIKRTPLLCGLLSAAVLVLLPNLVQAQCKNWDASGEWEIRQRGMGDHITVRLEQTGRVLTGSADYDAKGAGAFEGVHVTGRVDGTIDGDRFSVQIFWPDNLTGVYNATVLPSGRLDGVTYDKNKPKISQTWNSQNPLKCAPAGPSKPFKMTYTITPPAPPAPKPIRHSGKARTSTPAPPPAPMKVPGIVATPAILAPGYPTGTVVLTWDGGPDHPYAEVWVKVNGAPETFVVEQGKGTRPETVQRGGYYEYILTDAGKTLATVNFYVPPY